MAIDPQNGSGLLTPTQLGRLLPVAPALSSPEEGWMGTVLQQFHAISGEIELPEHRDEVLISYRARPFLMNFGSTSAKLGCRWIEPGQIGVTPAGSRVHRHLKGKPDLTLLHLSPACLRSVAEEIFEVDPTRVTLISRVGVTDNTSDRLAQLLSAEAENPAAGTPLLVESLVRALMIHLLRNHSNLSPNGPESHASMSPGRVRHVIDHMRAHLTHDQSLAQLARIGGLSPTRFVRAFRQATGRPPYRFLVELRIEKACELLKATALPVVEVGLQCGFTQPSHFSTMFRKTTGLSPGAWRRGHQL